VLHRGMLTVYRRRHISVGFSCWSGRCWHSLCCGLQHCFPYVMVNLCKTYLDRIVTSFVNGAVVTRASVVHVLVETENRQLKEGIHGQHSSDSSFNPCFWWLSIKVGSYRDFFPYLLVMIVVLGLWELLQTNFLILHGSSPQQPSLPK
jgi:hypothetical protein